MPEKVSGFLTSDGAFYHTSAEAQRHEAQREIVQWCQRQQPAYQQASVLALIEALADPIQEYLHASEEIRDLENETRDATTEQRSRVEALSDAVFAEAAEDRADDAIAKRGPAPV
jgi:hypothetical protein